MKTCLWLFVVSLILVQETASSMKIKTETELNRQRRSMENHLDMGTGCCKKELSSKQKEMLANFKTLLAECKKETGKHCRNPFTWIRMYIFHGKYSFQVNRRRKATSNTYLIAWPRS